jgi:hypothetical protein
MAGVLKSEIDSRENIYFRGGSFFRSLQVPDFMEEHSARIFVVENIGTVEVTY